MTRIGSLCSGYGGLDLGLTSVIGGQTAWLCEYDKHPSTILAERFPGVPNYGDIITTDWSRVGPVDWITAGYPCQPFSHAGKRQGTDDERHIWPHVAECIRLVRPGRVLLENVAGHLSMGFGDVLGDLAALGYDARWGVVRAADVGAPHGRKRVFIVATDADRQQSQGVGDVSGLRGRPDARAELRLHSDVAPDASGERHGRGQDSRGLGRLDGEDAGSTRQRQRTREVPEHRGGEAAADATSADRRGTEPDDLTSTIGRAAEPGERPSADHTGRTEERRGLDEDIRQERPGQDVPRVRCDIHAPTLRNQARGPDSLPDQDVLFTELREHATGSGQGHAALASQEAQGGSVLGVPDNDGASRSPHRQEPGEQRPGEPGDALRELSLEVALAGGPRPIDWGPYAAAIHRWELILGREAPAPTEPGRNGPRLSPRFVEFLMGLPAGWVTDVDIPRNAQLKALGNGVVPQQAAAAVRWLMDERVAA